ncbi:MAG: tRNA sulfurtransferase [Promethearchaeota archaeon]
MKYDGVLLRCEELQYHSEQSKDQMITLLISNLKAALKEHNCSVGEILSKCQFLYIETSAINDVVGIAASIFGVTSISPVMVTTADAADSISQNPAVEVEWCDENAYVSTETIDGLGGLPTGSQGRVVCTISGGLDSPVASYKMMKRGCVPIFLHFDNVPYGDDSTRDLAIRQAKRLTEYVYGHEVMMYVVPHGEDLTEVLRHAPRKMTCVFCRRNMYRLAQEVALKEDADAIVTGEIIGEQASQTTRNLHAEESAICEIPIIRPCIGDDKVDIERLAMKIRTYEFAHEAVSCCSLPPEYPTIHANLGQIAPAEKDMDMEWLAKEIAEAEVIILKEGGRSD